MNQGWESLARWHCNANKQAPQPATKNCMKTVLLFIPAVILAFVLGMNLPRNHHTPPPPKDFTTLKRDLLELQQSCGISREVGLLYPERLARQRNQLANDYKLQGPPRPVEADKSLKLTLQRCEELFTAARGYAHVDPYWKLIDASLSLHCQTQLALEALEAEEHTP